jgi:gas vesicle protein
MTADHKAGTTRDHRVGTNGDPKARTAGGSAAGKIVAFVAGAAVGAAAALLLAPKSGEELRGDIADAVNDGAKQVRSAGRNLKQRAQEIVELATDTVKDALDAGDVAYTKAKKA